MSARSFGAPLSAMLFSVFLTLVISAPAMAAAPINFAMAFYGPWVSTTSYKPGYVVTYNGASYLCLVANGGVTPSSNTTDWAILDAPGTLVDARGDTAEGAGALGTSAGISVNTGSQNTAFGDGALGKNTTGANNTAVGVLALFSNTTGYNNTAYGVNALVNNTTGSNNTAYGVSALLNNTTLNNMTGYNNTALGVVALI